MTRRAYLRIAHPLTSWVWSNCPDGAARAVALEVRVEPPKPRSRAPHMTKSTSLAEYVPRNRR